MDVKSSKEPMTLDHAKVGLSTRILDIKGPKIVVSRLLELGFLKGDPIEIRGTAPWGEPIVVEVRGTFVALRKEEARCILI